MAACCAFEGWPGCCGDETFGYDVVEDFGPIDAVPPPHPGVKYNRVETGNLDVLEGDEVVGGGGTAHGAGDELVCDVLDAWEVAEVYLDAEDVDALGGLFGIVAGAGAGLEEL